MKQSKYAIIILGFFFVLLFLYCTKESPVSQEESVDFAMNMIYQDAPLAKSLCYSDKSVLSKNRPSLGPIQELNKSYDKARVMVIDMSGFGGWVDIWETDEYHDYRHERDEVNEAGGLTDWSDYERLIYKYFNVVANETVSMTADSAKGHVSGVVGANYILVSLTKGDEIHYWGETGSVVMAHIGETQDVTVYVHQYGDWELEADSAE